MVSMLKLTSLARCKYFTSAMRGCNERILYNMGEECIEPRELIKSKSFVRGNKSGK